MPHSQPARSGWEGERGQARDDESERRRYNRAHDERLPITALDWPGLGFKEVHHVRLPQAA